MALSHSEAAECATREPTHASALFPAAATTSHSAHHALQGLRIDASHAATAPTHAAKRVASASHGAGPVFRDAGAGIGVVLVASRGRLGGETVVMGTTKLGNAE